MKSLCKIKGKYFRGRQAQRINSRYVNFDFIWHGFDSAVSQDFFTHKHIWSQNLFYLCVTKISSKYVSGNERRLNKIESCPGRNVLYLKGYIAQLNWPYDELTSYTLLRNTTTNSATWWRHIAQNPAKCDNRKWWKPCLRPNEETYMRPPT